MFGIYLKKVNNPLFITNSYSAAFYTLNGKNVDVMLESAIIHG